MRSTAVVLRKRSAWRELLHALPISHREALWLKRDKVEMNEAVLRRPYYTLKRVSDKTQLRETLVTPGVIGPSGHTNSPHTAGAPLPRYPSGWETVAPQSSTSE